ncbi:MAG: hypothetical protein U1E15_08360 [Hyphomicrobiales bacterium]
MRAAAILFLLSATPALAGNSSAYTTYKLDSCKVIEKNGGVEEASDVWLCQGYQGKLDYSFVYFEGDLRGFMPMGRNARNHCAATQTFNHFNSAGDTVEWRLKDGKPIAAIVRWTVSYDPEDSEKTKTWLVVTKLEKKNSCHMAFVEGAYPNANEKARDLADSLAGSFTCKGSKAVFVANAGTDTDITQDSCE